MARHGAPQRPRIQYKSWWIRALAALSLCLLGGQGLLPSLHQSLVSHRVCAEHGELVEAHDPHGAAATLASGDSSAAQDGELTFRGVAESDHDEHCGCVLGTFLSGSEARRTDALVLGAVELGATSKVAAADVAASPEILAFAPKLSPPV